MQIIDKPGVRISVLVSVRDPKLKAGVCSKLHFSGSYAPGAGVWLTPGAYEPEKCRLDHNPAYTITGRHEQKIISTTPAPGAYEPEKCRLDHNPAYTIVGRHEQKIIKLSKSK
uniref:Uncharacterized protein n=1 Tax=Megaselia scalaris TaxID=36166 RepID=T1GVT7_MEGSC